MTEKELQQLVDEYLKKIGELVSDLENKSGMTISATITLIPKVYKASPGTRAAKITFTYVGEPAEKSFNYFEIIK